MESTVTTLSRFKQTLIDETKAGHVLCPSVYPFALEPDRIQNVGVARFCVLAHSSSPVTSQGSRALGRHWHQYLVRGLSLSGTVMLLVLPRSGYSVSFVHLLGVSEGSRDKIHAYDSAVSVTWFGSPSPVPLCVFQGV